MMKNPQAPVVGCHPGPGGAESRVLAAAERVLADRSEKSGASERTVSILASSAGRALAAGDRGPSAGRRAGCCHRGSRVVQDARPAPAAPSMSTHGSDCGLRGYPDRRARGRDRPAVRRDGGGRRGGPLPAADRRAAVVGAQPRARGRVRRARGDPLVPGTGTGPAGRRRRPDLGLPRPRGARPARPGARARRRRDPLGPAAQEAVPVRARADGAVHRPAAALHRDRARAVPAVRAADQLRLARRGVPRRPARTASAPTRTAARCRPGTTCGPAAPA